MRMFALALMIAAVMSVSVAAQVTSVQTEDAPPPPPRRPVRVAGEARVYRGTPESRNAWLDISILGDGFQMGERANDLAFYSKTDAIDLTLAFNSNGPKLLEPALVDFNVRVYYSRNSKFRDDHSFAIFVEDKPLLSGELTVKTRVGDLETLTVAYLQLQNFKYQDFAKMARAKKVTFQIGQTKFDLTPEAIQGFRDLNSLLIEK